LDRNRVLEALTQTLGQGALLAGPQLTSIAPSAAAPFAVRWWVIGGLAAVGAMLFVAHPWTVAESQPPVVVASTVSATEPAPSTNPPPATNAGEELRTEVPATSPRPAARPSRARISDSLPEEVRLLSLAEKQLNSGHADEALRTLGEHERRFPGGALVEERLAARIQALCGLGRTAEARADLARLAHAHPGSPHLSAKRFCAINPAP
jgi:hypothetical protein